jgi:hypothetical protein
MMKYLSFVLPVAFAASFTIGFAGCDAADTAFDCQSVCSRYRDCFNKDYDVSKCRSDCRDKAKNDSTYEKKADDCAACIDDRSCTSATFSCAIPCAGIVP